MITLQMAVGGMRLYVNVNDKIENRKSLKMKTVTSMYRKHNNPHNNGQNEKTRT